VRHSEDFDDINYHYNEQGRLERIDSTNEKVKSSNELSESIELAQSIFNGDEILTEKELKTRLKVHFIPSVNSENKAGKEGGARNKAQREIDNWLKSIMTTAGAGNFKLHENIEFLKN
jgi:Holliday junction resolvase RusA-like endonuclease